MRDADAVITIVGFPPDVEEVYFGEKGIIANARPGTLVIDMTTTSPRLSQRIYTEAADKGLPALDAPVSGGDTGARAGTLAIMVGGDREAFERAMPSSRPVSYTHLKYDASFGTVVFVFRHIQLYRLGI